MFVFEWLDVAKRTDTAIYLIANLIMYNKKIDINYVCSILEKHVANHIMSDSMTIYYSSQIIKWLQENCEDKERLAQIEWIYFKAIEDDCIPKTLYYKMANDSRFFMSLVSLVYRSKNNHEELRTISQDLLSNAWNVLNSWDHMPGLQTDGMLDIEKMHQWIKDVKEIASVNEIYTITMELIGKVSYYAPKNSDGFFIHDDVAIMLDNRDAEIQRHGYEIQAYNSRGVHTIDASGIEDVKIAMEWEKKADEAEKKSYIRFAYSLRSIAATFRDDAKRNAIFYSENFIDNPEE